MSARRTVEQIRKRTNDGWHGNEITIATPDEAKVWLVTSPMAECLTHLVRYVSLYQGRMGVRAQCGNEVVHVVPVPIKDETFVCGRCITMAEKYGEPTFGMIPTSGCEVSNGKRTGRNGRSLLRSGAQMATWL